MAAQKSVVRFSNNANMPLRFRDNDAEHVASMLLILEQILPPKMFKMARIVAQLHDASEVFGEPKTQNGILFKGLNEGDLPEFESIAFKVATIYAAMAATSKQPEADFLKIITNHKATVEPYKTTSAQTMPTTPLMVVMQEFLNRAELKQQGLHAKQRDQVSAVVSQAVAYYNDYTDPTKRQTDPVIAAVKLADKLSGIKQLTLCSTNYDINMPHSPRYFFSKPLPKKTLRANWGSLPTGWTPSAEIITDACNLKAKGVAHTSTLQDQKTNIFAATAQAITLQVGAKYLETQRPFYVINPNITEPNWQSTTQAHTNHYQKFKRGGFGKHAVSAPWLAAAFVGGVDIKNPEAVKNFTTHNCLYPRGL
jgi:hypothetical protein